MYLLLRLVCLFLLLVSQWAVGSARHLDHAKHRSFLLDELLFILFLILGIKGQSWGWNSAKMRSFVSPVTQGPLELVDLFPP